MVPPMTGRDAEADGGVKTNVQPGSRWWTRHDTVTLARLPVGFALSWLGREDQWDWIAARIAERRARRKADWFEKETAWLRAMVGDRLDEAAVRQAVVDLVAAFRVRQLQMMRVHRPGCWTPRTSIVGMEHVDAARIAGRGAILWVPPFVGSAVVTKLTCAAHGLPIVHLSRWSHGSSRSRIGMALLNRYQLQAEKRFLKERVIIGEGDAGIAATRRLAQHLRENGIVTITVAAEGAAVELPFMEGRIRIANGAVKLARQTGAALIPAVTRRQTNGSFITYLEPPLDPGSGMAGIRQAVAGLARAIERHALAAPGQFFWHTGIILPGTTDPLPVDPAQR